jgi:hypothetical protein
MCPPTALLRARACASVCECRGRSVCVCVCVCACVSVCVCSGVFVCMKTPQLFTTADGVLAAKQGLDQHDAGYFRLTRTEAVALDPQTRSLLEVTLCHCFC